MKLLFVNFCIPGFAGDAVQLQYIIHGLEDLGHDVTLVVPDGDPFYFDKAKSNTYSSIRKKLIDAGGSTIIINGIKVMPIHCSNSKLGYYCPDASHIANKILPDYDAVYITNWYYHIAFVFSKICQKKDIPFVISAMGAFQKQAKKIKKLRKNFLDYLYTKKMFLTASGFHSVGELETNEYIEAGADPNKIYRVDHGIVLNNFKLKNQTKIFERIGLVQNENYLITIGRIDQKKGLEILLEGFKKIQEKYPKLKLIIVGTGIDEYVSKMKDLSNTLGLNKNVIFTGFVSEDEKIELLSSAKIFVGTSHSDVHTTTVIEAMTMGLPIVITKASDFPEVDDYNCGITIDTNPDSVYDAVLKLLQNNDLKTIANNSRKLIQDKFLLKDRVKEFEEMFTSVIHK